MALAVGPRKAYDDLWVCQNAGCVQAWTEDEHRVMVHGVYFQRADRLTASRLKETYRIPMVPSAGG